MTVPVSQLSVPLSQNTAPVFKFDCLYTHDLVRKQKRWQDGVLAFHTFNKRVMVYDLTNNFIGDTHWRENDSIQEGDDLRLDRGVLVSVGEARGRKEQDISEIFVRRNVATREANLSPRKVVLGRATGPKPQSITAVLEAGKNKLNRTHVAQIPLRASHGSSPYETDSPKPPKRRKLANEGFSQPASVEKLPVNRDPVAIARNCGRSELNSSRESRNTRQERGDCFEPCNTLSDRNATPELQRTRTSKGAKIIEDTSLNVRKSKKKSEQTKGSKSTETNVSSAVVKDKLNESGEQKSRTTSNVAKLRSKECSAADQAKPERSKQRLTFSKSRRKKLIFNSISTAETGQAGITDPDQLEPRHMAKQSDYSLTEQSQHPITKEKPRDVILISSPPKEWTEFESSEDESSEFDKNLQHAIFEGVASDHEELESSPTPGRSNTLINKAVSDVNLIGNNQVPLRNRATADTNNWSEFVADESLLAALVGDPVETCTGDSDAEDKELDNTAPIAVDGQSRNDTSCDDNFQLTARKTIDLPEPSRRAEAIRVDSISLSSAGPTNHPQTNRPLASPIQESNTAINHEIPLPITTAPATHLPELNILAAQTSPPRLPNVHDPSKTSNLLAQPEAAAVEETATNSPSNSPPDMHQLKQRTHKSIAPIPFLLRPLPQTSVQQPTTYQKPLPQFRPPQHISRRAPLQKSMTDGKLGSGVENGTIALTRAGSDGEAVQMMGDVQREYDDAGPWTREAFDLFGWTPEMPKGKILGPVAGRGCSCRAAAAAAAGGS